ncbi:hypothetical protein BDB00DRAFT_875031 [Zychaea mexicana]|uniref:uncharacterized protein n=1 Tax=Zychaea mexicana TaxID=64656 RepID=UPI0022FE7A2D|nr:uncharacterized protein BDB00DRAFT_875031 [Zychaea mexicana]KAI9490699.1 hypothetical protein BDB00DRAFT_875031 [Zychaea mexicana]
MSLATATILKLHIVDTIAPPPSPHTLTIHKASSAISRHRILVADAFVLDLHLGHLRCKPRDELGSYPRIISRLFSLLDSYALLHHAFFYRACFGPGLAALGDSDQASAPHDVRPLLHWFKLGDFGLCKATNELFQNTAIQHNFYIDGLTDYLTKGEWQRFWSTMMAIPVHNLIGSVRFTGHFLAARPLFHMQFPQDPPNLPVPSSSKQLYMDYGVVIGP